MKCVCADKIYHSRINRIAISLEGLSQLCPHSAYKPYSPMFSSKLQILVNQPLTINRLHFYEKRMPLPLLIVGL